MRLESHFRTSVQLPPTRMDWEQLCKQKKDAQQAALPKEFLLSNLPADVKVIDVPRTAKILTDQELEITETTDVSLLLQKLRSGHWTSYSVTLAFIKRACIAHQLTNCLTEFFFDDALQRAKELDDLRTAGEPLGPLHGLPISLKDQLAIKGVELNMGFASWVGRISDEDAALVKILKKAGAVLYCRTNVPQTLMAGETVNYVYGRTSNPWNIKRTSGGSSGGEGALIALRGSPLGIGSDIGGSVRIPSAYCGLYGLRPTMRRVPYWGAANTFLGLEAIESVLGPLSNSLSGCVELLKAVTTGSPEDYDPKCVGINWREDLYQLKDKGGRKAKLAFAYYEWDGVVMTAPPVRRAVRLTIDALRRSGHEVIAWTPKDHAAANAMLATIWGSDGGKDFKETFKESGEPLHPEIRLVASELSVYESWQLNVKKDAYRKAKLDQWLATASQTSTGRPIDALIAPATPSPAVVHGGSPPYFGYTGMFNFIDWPALVLPITQVDPTQDAVDATYKPISELDAKVQASYDAESAAGLPIGLQLVGRRFKEEELLGIGEVVDAALKAA